MVENVADMLMYAVIISVAILAYDLIKPRVRKWWKRRGN